MIETVLDGVESIVIRRAKGNLRLRGGADVARLRSERAPIVERDASRVTLELVSNGELDVTPGVIVELAACSGNVDVEEIAAPLALHRVHGNLRLRTVGSVTVADEVGGNLAAEFADRIDVERAGGSLLAASVKSVSARRVGGNAECRKVDGDIVLDRVEGDARFSQVGGKVAARAVAGKLSARDASSIEAGAVGRKLKALDISGALVIGRVAGRVVAENIGGDVAIGSVSGHASLARLSGNLDLGEAEGAVDLRGPYPAGRKFRVASGGRVRVELDAAAVEVHAKAAWGRIRVVGVDRSDLRWAGSNCVDGTIGVSASGAAPLCLDVEASSGDVIIAGAGAARDAYDFCRARHEGRFGRRFARQFESLARELGEELPGFVSEVGHAVRRFAKDSGVFSSDVMRGVADDVRASARDALDEIERALADLRARVPDDVGENLARLGRNLADAVAKVADAARASSRDVRREMRERVREAARELREAIREAAERARERPADEPREHPPAGANRAAGPSERERQILKILEAVRRGEIEPEQADDLIRQWFDARPVTENGNESG